MTRIVTTYEPIRRTASKSVPCPICGKKVKRQRTFKMTLNPFNKNPDGTVRDRSDIWAALGEQVKEWSAKAEAHPRCAERDAERLVTVCDACLQASCWQGEFMCQEAQGAGTVQKSVAELRLLNREHPDYWRAL